MKIKTHLLALAALIITTISASADDFCINTGTGGCGASGIINIGELLAGGPGNGGPGWDPAATGGPGDWDPEWDPEDEATSGSDHDDLAATGGVVHLE